MFRRGGSAAGVHEKRQGWRRFELPHQSVQVRVWIGTHQNGGKWKGAVENADSGGGGRAEGVGLNEAVPGRCLIK